MLSPSRILSRAASAPRLAWKLARHGRPRRLVLFGPVSLGDDLMCTALFRAWRERGERDLWMMTRNSALFAGNPDIDRVISIDDYYAKALARLGVSVIQPYYVSLKPDEGDAPPPLSHFIRQMGELAGLRGEFSLRPFLHLTAAERTAGRLAENQIAIHSTGRSAKFVSANKEWLPGRFQEVVTALRSRFNFVQLGAPSDPPLDGTRDLRGRTTLRETAAIVAASTAVVCQEGFLMHLARAVDVRAVVIYGGALHPSITGYVANENLYSAVPCAPCWRRNRCDHAHVCMSEILSDHAIAALERLVAAPAVHALPVETVSL